MTLNSVQPVVASLMEVFLENCWTWDGRDWQLLGEFSSDMVADYCTTIEAKKLPLNTLDAIVLLLA